MIVGKIYIIFIYYCFQTLIWFLTNASSTIHTSYIKMWHFEPDISLTLRKFNFIIFRTIIIFLLVWKINGNIIFFINLCSICKKNMNYFPIFFKIREFKVNIVNEMGKKGPRIKFEYWLFNVCTEYIILLENTFVYYNKKKLILMCINVVIYF